MLFVTVFMPIIISGCSFEMNSEIGPAHLTTDQQDIINLFTTDNQQFLIFNYQTENAFESMDFWVEVYSYGELIENLGGLSFISDSSGLPLTGDNHANNQTI